MDYLFGVNFASQNKLEYFLSNYEVKVGEFIVTESSRGLELGKIASLPKIYQIKEGEEIPFTYISRIATEEDLKAYQENEEECKEAIKLVQLQADNLSLDMNVTSADYTLDKTKLTISYLASDRVDFRELLKVLASLYHCRIELRQIGPRDKAKMIGGIGICGLPLCCSTFLNEFDGISITMAKNQMLALNIPKLSGHCGKLICCLKYEDDAYTFEKKDLPRVGLRIYYQNAMYRITSINIITKMVRLESPENILVVPLSTLEPYLPKKENEDFNKKETPINENKIEENVVEEVISNEIEEEIEVEVSEEIVEEIKEEEVDIIGLEISSDDNLQEEKKEKKKHFNKKRHNHYRNNKNNNTNSENSSSDENVNQENNNRKFKNRHHHYHKRRFNKNDNSNQGTNE